MEPVAYPNRAAALRQRLLGGSSRPPKPFTARSGATYWLRTPSLAQRGRILDAAGVKPKDGESPSAATMVLVTAHAALALVVDEEGKPVFDGSELDGILSADMDSEVAEVAAAAAGMLGGNASEGEASGGAAGAASPTSSPAS